MERLQWTPENPDDEPVIALKVEGESRYELERSNTTLFTFLGHTAFNHIYYSGNDEDDERFYIFAHQPAYEPIAAYMVENDYTMVLNQTEVPVVDQRAFFRSVMRDVDKGVPEEWTNGDN